MEQELVNQIKLLSEQARQLGHTGDELIKAIKLIFETEEVKFDKYLVLWNNPRSIEKCIILQEKVGENKELTKVQLLSCEDVDFQTDIVFRKPEQLFDTLEEVNNYLEKKDLESIH